MSTTVSYKGSAIATVENNTKTLTTAGKYLEADVILTDVSQSGSTDFIITVSYNSTTEMWEPDCTFAEYQTAHNAGKTITVQTDDPDHASADGTTFGSAIMEYVVRQYTSGLYHGQQRTLIYEYWYGFTANGVSLTDDLVCVGPTGTLSIAQNGTGIDVAAYAKVNVAVPSPSAGTEGTPVATKGTVSNHQVAVTPSVTNVGGVIQGGTHSGTPVTVSASELVSGTKSISQNGTGIDVSEYASVDVAVPSVETNFIVTVSWNSSTQRWEPNKTFSEIQTAYNAGKTIAVVSNQQSADNAVDGEYHTGANPYFEYWVRKYMDGYSPQMIREIGYHLTSTGISTEDDVNYIRPTGSETKTANGTYDVTNLATLVVNVSGSSKNIQVNQTGGSVRTNGYTSTGVSLTVAKAGTYKVSWTAWRSSSQGTMGTNLYKNGTAGTAQQTWTSTYGQHIVLNNQTYAQGDILTLYATAGSTTRYCYVGDLVIVEQ